MTAWAVVPLVVAAELRRVAEEFEGDPAAGLRLRRDRAEELDLLGKGNPQ